MRQIPQGLATGRWSFQNPSRSSEPNEKGTSYLKYTRMYTAVLALTSSTITNMHTTHIKGPVSVAQTQEKFGEDDISGIRPFLLITSTPIYTDVCTSSHQDRTPRRPCKQHLVVLGQREQDESDIEEPEQRWGGPTAIWA